MCVLAAGAWGCAGARGLASPPARSTCPSRAKRITKSRSFCARRSATVREAKPCATGKKNRGLSKLTHVRACHPLTTTVVPPAPAQSRPLLVGRLRSEDRGDLVGRVLSHAEEVEDAAG